MSEASFTKEGLGKYKRREVDAFIERMNVEHRRELTAKEDEIKRLFSENEYLKQENASLNEKTLKQSQEQSDLLDEKEREINEMNARIGEKITFAEEAARTYAERVKRSCEADKELAEQEIARRKVAFEEEMANRRQAEEARIEEMTAQYNLIKKKVAAYLETVQGITRRYDEKTSALNQTLHNIRQNLEDTQAAIDHVASEYSHAAENGIAGNPTGTVG